MSSQTDEVSASLRKRSGGGATTRSVLRDGAIVLAVTALLFGLVEFGIRLVAPQDVDTTFISGSSLGLRDDLLGHLNRPNSHTVVRAPEYEVEYKVSAQGFRDEATYSPVAAPGVTRVLLLGDSFAFGTGTDYEDIWPVVLERNLRAQGHQVEVIKAGVPAFDTRSEVLYLEQLMERYSPDIAILTFLPNDLFTNRPIVTAGDAAPSAGEGDLRKAGVVTTGDKKSDLHSLTLVKRLLMMSDRLYVSLYLMTQRREIFAFPPTDTLTRQIDLTKGLFSRAHDLCRSEGCELMVLSLPQQFQLLADGVDGIDPAYIDRTFAEMAEERGIQWIALLPILAEAYRVHGQDLYFRYDGHLNPAGNAVVGATLANVVSEWLSVHEAARQP